MLRGMRDGDWVQLGEESVEETGQCHHWVRVCVQRSDCSFRTSKEGPFPTAPSSVQATHQHGPGVIELGPWGWKNPTFSLLPTVNRYREVTSVPKDLLLGFIQGPRLLL